MFYRPGRFAFSPLAYIHLGLIMRLFRRFAEKPAPRLLPTNSPKSGAVKSTGPAGAQNPYSERPGDELRCVGLSGCELEASHSRPPDMDGYPQAKKNTRVLGPEAEH